MREETPLNAYARTADPGAGPGAGQFLSRPSRNRVHRIAEARATRSTACHNEPQSDRIGGGGTSASLK
jgi:hypothetical protein